MNYRLEVYGMDDSTSKHERFFKRACYANAAYNVWLKLLEDGVATHIKLVNMTTGFTVKEAVLCPTE